MMSTRSTHAKPPDGASNALAPAEPIELVAIDLDGTLLTSAKQISPRTLAAIDEALRRKVLIAIASARPPRGALHLYKQLKLRTAMINYNGALIFDPPSRHVLLHQPVPAEIARAVVLFARGMFADVVVHAERLNQLLTDRHDPLFQTETSKLFAPNVIAPLDQWLNRPVTKLMLLGPTEQMDQLEQAINQQFRDAIGQPGSEKPLRVVRTDEHLLQIMHPRTSKALAVSMLADFYSVPQARVMAIGDALNDYGMVRWAGFGVAVGNARPIVKQAAKVVVADNDHDGVAEALERYVLGIS